MSRSTRHGPTELREFVAAADAPDRSLALVNRTKPRPVGRMLEELFDDQPIGVREVSLPDEEDDAVYLLDDGEVVAASGLSAFEESILLVNSDIYVTGARGLEEADLPAAIEGLDGCRFTLRGYPESDREKLLLIAVSRHIERLALDGGGRLRASFQRLSRIRDERGTRRVYDRLGGTGTDVHVYGVPDWTPPPEMGVTMHGGWSDDFRDAWFVVRVPEGAADGAVEPDRDADAEGRYAALVAVEDEPRTWEGFWTFDPGCVAEIDAYVAREL
ncbi:MAG: DICT sensory domain-containing protein [Haloferacaceae archaeon]